MKTKLLLILTIFSITSIFSQTEDAWVYFTDKPDEEAYFEVPLNMLTQRAIDRREKFNIAYDTKDVPLYPVYVAAVANATGITVLARSKWLNALHVQGTKEDIDFLFNTYTFVNKVEYADRTTEEKGVKQSKVKKTSKWNEYSKTQTTFNYGDAYNQITQLNGDILHENGFTGEGIHIAVMDTAFPNVNSNNSAFDRLLTIDEATGKHNLLGGKNFVSRSEDYIIDTNGTHGAHVLSTMTGYLEEGLHGVNYVGTAPDASYYLFVTEKNSGDDIILEESLWVEAAERADSLGVDVINTSLGYADFYEDTNYNHSYSDMDGETTFITRGAEIAFSKGMIIVSSAGNEGTSSWNYITSPADGSSVLAVGAVDSSGTIASFSSYGPSADGRIKPDVCALGYEAYYVNTSGVVTIGYGTSYASPILAGAIACLWQAFPNKTNAEIIQLVKESAHLYSNPNNHEGYGIPDFEAIYNQVLNTEEIQLEALELSIYPNPINDNVYINFPSQISEVNLTVYNILGKKQLQQIVESDKPSINVSYLPKGMYIFKVSTSESTSTFKVLKN